MGTLCGKHGVFHQDFCSQCYQEMQEENMTASDKKDPLHDILLRISQIESVVGVGFPVYQQPPSIMDRLAKLESLHPKTMTAEQLDTAIVRLAQKVGAEPFKFSNMVPKNMPPIYANPTKLSDFGITQDEVTKQVSEELFGAQFKPIRKVTVKEYTTRLKSNERRRQLVPGLVEFDDIILSCEPLPLHGKTACADGKCVCGAQQWFDETKQAAPTPSKGVVYMDDETWKKNNLGDATFYHGHDGITYLRESAFPTNVSSQPEPTK